MRTLTAIGRKGARRDEQGEDRSEAQEQVYFKDQDLDLNLQAFPLNFQTYGAAATGEGFYAASWVNEKDLQS